MYCNSFEGRVFLNATATAGTTGTSEQTLMTYTLPGNSLYKAGQGLRIRAGFLNNSSDTITWKLYFGTTSVSGSCTTTTGGELEIDVFELAAKSHATVTRGRIADTTVVKATYATDTQDDTASAGLIIKLTATAGASGANATAEYLSVEFIQNA